jgi:hydroxymethylpyrimidine/phosphomethylpyrimidine kinase
MGTMNMKNNIAALTIAGSDSGGGAGIQADLKTFSALGVFGTSAITAITAQNLDGVTAIQAVETNVVQKQIIAVLEGFPIKAIKTGMLFSADIINVIIETLSQETFKPIPIVVDPVFVATSGSKLIHDDGITLLKEKLFPIARLITPNIPEAEALTGLTIKTPQQMKVAGQQIFDSYGAAVLMKGGHLENRALDILIDKDGYQDFESEMVQGVNSHGSGCTLASAIAATIAKGKPLKEAVTAAKNYIHKTLTNSLRLTPTLQVMNHFH